jgi:hypothetical protein
MCAHAIDWLVQTMAACDFIWNPQVTGKPYPIAKLGFQANFRQAIFKGQLTSEGEVRCSFLPTSWEV